MGPETAKFTQTTLTAISSRLKRKRLTTCEGRRAVRTHSLSRHQKNTRPHRPLFGDLSFWTQPQFLDSSGFSALVFSPSPLLPSDFAGASHFQLVHIHKIKSKWSLVFLLCFRQPIRINF